MSFGLKFFVCRHVSMWGFQNHVCPEKKSPYLRPYQFYSSSNWYINGKVSTSTTAWKPKNWIFFQEKFEIRILTCDEELNSPYLRPYQSLCSNWCMNGRVFKKLIFFFEKNAYLNVSAVMFCKQSLAYIPRNTYIYTPYALHTYIHILYIYI